MRRRSYFNRQVYIVVLGLILIAALIGLVLKFNDGKKVSSRSGSTFEKPHMDVRVVDGKTIRTGCEQKLFTLEEDQIGTLKVTTNVEKGKLDIYVFAAEDTHDKEYEGTNLGTHEFSVIIEEPGDYKVWTEVKDFVGSYEFEWTTEEVKKK